MKESITEISTNSGNKIKVFRNLKIGQKLKAKETIISKDDIGASGLTFDYESYIKGKTYKVHSTYIWGWVKIGYVKDESGSLGIATPELFKLIN